MAIAEWAVISQSPYGHDKPILTFFPSQESAADHAQVITKDFNRDTFVVLVLARNYAKR